MYSHLVVAIDGSEVAGRALEHALVLAKAFGSSVTIVHVAEPVAAMGAGYSFAAGLPSPASVMVETAQVATRDLLDRAHDIAKAAGVAATALWVENRGPAEGIVEAADIVGAELIVMGTNGRRGLGRMILGSQASSVLQQAKVPVLVTR